ncbi:MAG: winged helix-turn-helix domain-containing protein [Candidatus Omnitrophota bacterium]
MIIEIGIVAGEIWHYLDQKGEVTLAVLTKALDRSPENILMSLGWLAREGHVILVKINNDYRISLRKDA